MTILINSTLLRNALAAALKIIPSKAVMPIVENVLIKTDKDSYIDVVATDGETTLHQRLDAKCSGLEEPFGLCIPAKTILDPISTIAEQMLTIEIDDKEVLLKYASGNFNFMGLDAKEFPERKPIDAEKQTMVTIPGEVILNGINSTFFATTEDTLRPVMASVFFNINSDNVICVATDAKKLAKVTQKVKTNVNSTELIMPRRMAATLKNILNKNVGDCTLCWDNQQVAIRFGQTVLATKVVEGKIPPYDKVIPKDNHLEAIVDSKSFITVLKRMNSFANASTGQVVVNFENDSCWIKSQDIDYNRKATEEMKCSYQGVPIQISFRAPIMIEVLNSMPSGDVCIKMSSPTRPILVSSVNADNESLYLVMPMTITTY